MNSPALSNIPRKRIFSGVYAPAHELATNLLAVKLQQKLKELQLEVSTEQPLKNINGRLDLKIAKGKIRPKNSGKTSAIVEVKTGFKVNTAGMPCSLRECGRSLGELQNRRNADSNSRKYRKEGKISLSRQKYQNK